MEDRKQTEVNYYDKEAENSLDSIKESGSLSTFDPFLLESYRFLKHFLEKGYQDKDVLDYGCGGGLHIPWLATSFRKVVGIDLSQKSLNRASHLIKEKVLENKVSLVLGDCEKMEFPSESFDVVFDGGTFSSLDLDIALQQIHRVLKPDGLLVGIETLGHNPITNIKRTYNEFSGKRTSWAVRHIFKLQDLTIVRKYFTVDQLRFFHLTSFLAIPFLNFPGGSVFLAVLQKLDHALLATCPFLKKYSFKVVFVFKKRYEKVI